MKRLKQLFTAIFALELLLGCSTQKQNTPSQMYIHSDSSQTTFNVGEAFNHEGLEVFDIKTFEPIVDYALSIDDGYLFTEQDVGETSVVVSKKGYKDASYTIEITNYPRLIIESYPKQEYEVGEKFTLEGLVVTDGHNVVTGYNSNIVERTVLNEVGTFTVTLSKSGYFSVSFDICVSLAHSLFVKNNPNKTSYQQGERLSLTGLVIEDEKHQLIDEYELSMQDGDLIKNYGEIHIKVNKSGFIGTEVIINVTENDSSPSDSKTLNIYYLNDTHGSFIRQEIEGSTNEGGMAYIGQYILDKKEQNTLAGKETIILSGGDMFQGGLESNTTRGAIMIDAMNIIGFDAMVLGNHEFDWGESYIRQFSEILNCPLISANTFYSSNNARPDYLAPFAIINRGDLRVGIIGGAQENLGSSITGAVSKDFTFPNPVSYIKSYSSELRLSYNCDLVLAAFHDEGYDSYDGETSPDKFASLTDIDPLSHYRYVDAMFFAHDHYRKTGEYNDVPYLESGCNGRYVGLMSLTLNRDNYQYDVTNYSVSNTSAYKYCTSENEQISALVTKYAELIGDPNELIYTFKKSYSSDDFTYVVCHAMYWYVNEHSNLFGGVHVYIASHNLGGIRADVSSGEFIRRDLFKVFPFENELCIQICTQAQVNRTIAYNYYATYQDETIVYNESGYTNGVSISYISESNYAGRYQSGYVKYPYITRDALVEFLKNNIDNTL